MENLDLGQKIMVGLILVLCLVGVGAGIMDSVGSASQVEKSTSAGKITKVQRTRHSYSIEVEFQSGSSSYVFKDSVDRAAGKGLEVGKAVPVVFPVGHPEEAVVGDGSGRWRDVNRTPLLIYGLLGLFGVGAVVLLLRSGAKQQD